MKVSLIVAVSENGVIGKDNDLAWHLPKDMNFFKETTKHHFVIMGRKNYESIPEKYRPLPNRTNVVVTRNNTFTADNCIVTNSIENAIQIARKAGDNEPFIIGGGQIYKLALEKNLVDKIYLTRIHANLNGDTFFPKLDKSWKILSQKKYFKDENHKYNFSFIVLEKIN